MCNNDFKGIRKNCRCLLHESVFSLSNRCACAEESLHGSPQAGGSGVFGVTCPLERLSHLSGPWGSSEWSSSILSLSGGSSMVAPTDRVSITAWWDKHTPAYCHHLHPHTVTASGDVTDSEPVWHLKKWLVSSLLVNKKNKMFQGVTKMFDGDSKTGRVMIQWQFYNYRKRLRYLFKLYLQEHNDDGLLNISIKTDSSSLSENLRSMIDD